MCEPQQDVQLTPVSGHTLGGRNKPHSHQSHFLSLALVSKTCLPAEDGAFLEKHNTIELITRAQTAQLFLFHCISSHFPTLPSLSEWSHSLAPPLHVERITKNHPPSDPKRQREQCFQETSKAELSRGHRGALAWYRVQPVSPPGSPAP